ncbi:MAG: DNA polymerase III subunit beta [Candidatus Yanofskybacteria bacterium CG10_big_fil_rev_8_21_14_0_10_37_15]|uniref:Beta sliding clamp n=1 Tax=Candidatus Yanofskybacteria bacterium CG10_big_fil_rev_8_21_14_0_10_37_15 TaxID=1975097 RepID=A0A2H0R600_9BACT|nr:MAG: DNA polymerase III subunit beta [Candidatus Yanofskybacteria bacterium CG10_big_fil_rev_8_21_14_0_10_37_15]
MKIVVNQKNLKRALGIVERIVSKNTTLPILNNILFKTENGRLRLSATNLEIGINYSIGSKIEETGEVAVPARIISDFISNISDEKIKLIVNNNNILNINSEHYKTKILGFDAKDFPLIPKIKTKPLLSMPVKILKNSLISVMDSVALSEARPELAGIFVTFENDKIVFASTDSFRLTEKNFDLKNSTKQSFIIPRNTVTELIRIAGDLEGDIFINLNDNQISFSNEDFEIVSRLVDGNYPDYKKVIPDKFISKIIINKNDLEKNIRLAGLFASNISDIKIQCLETKTKIVSSNSDKGEIETEIKSILKNQSFEVSLNYHYILDGLKIIDTEEVVLEYTGQGSPLVLKPGNDRKDLVYLIMPLRA